MPNYSLKPGRGPSAMGAAVGVIFVLIGIGWTVGAIAITNSAGMEAPIFIRILFPLFGVAWTLIALVNVIYNASNATRTNRFSTIDVVEGDGEPDPLSPYRPASSPVASSAASQPLSAGFCRHCGATLRGGDHFCGRCGKAVDAG